MILIATQLMPRGSLRTVLRDPVARQELRWYRRGRGIALDLAEALDYMHTQLRMLHSDLKARAGWRRQPCLRPCCWRFLSKRRSKLAACLRACVRWHTVKPLPALLLLAVRQCASGPGLAGECGRLWPVAGAPASLAPVEVHLQLGAICILGPFCMPYQPAQPFRLLLPQVLNSLPRTAVGFSRVYAAPEVLLGQRCTLAADVHR